MRRLFSTVAAILLLTFSTDPSIADGLIRRLPRDGEWARFYMTEKWDGDPERTRYVTISSVGKVVVDKDECRWIEIKFENLDNKSTSTLKMLIPARQIGPNRDSLGHVKKTWRKSNGEAPYVEANLKQLFPRLHLICPPAIADLRTTEETVAVEWQKGILPSKVAVGSSKLTTEAEITEASYRLLLNQQVPFGVAGVTLKLKTNNGDTGIVEFRLVDMGENATPELPELQ